MALDVSKGCNFAVSAEMVDWNASAASEIWPMDLGAVSADFDLSARTGCESKILGAFSALDTGPK